MLKILKTTLLIISVLCGTARAVLSQDSLPPLHTIHEEDIASLNRSYEDDILTVTLKNGIVHVYHHEDWDLEDRDPSISKKVRDTIGMMQRTYTKTEYAPQFPGGEEAWQKYIKDFCRKNKKAVKSEGPADFIIQFIVHMKGQVTDVSMVLNRNQSSLADLAIQAIQDGPPWVPATQNGRKVVCYQKQFVRLSY